jgi:hypothetical protein
LHINSFKNCENNAERVSWSKNLNNDGRKKNDDGIIIILSNGKLKAVRVLFVENKIKIVINNNQPVSDEKKVSN